MSEEQVCEWFQYYRPILMGIAAKHGFYEDAEDLVQEVFVRLIAGRYDSVAKNWLFVVLQNLMRDQARHHRILYITSLETLLFDPGQSDCALDEHMTLDAIHMAIAAMKPKERALMERIAAGPYYPSAPAQKMAKSRAHRHFLQAYEGEAHS